MTAYWTGQGAAKPLTWGAFDALELGPLKVSAIAVITKELRDLPPARAEALILQTMTTALARAQDERFLSEEPAVADVSPAGVLNGITPVSATADPIADLTALLENFEGNLETSYFITRPEVAVQLAMRGAASGSSAFADVGARNGGTLFGIPVIVSRYVGAGESSPSGDLILLDAAQILLGTGDVGIAAAGSASLEMLDNPSNNSASGTATTLVSMWQTNSVALRVERYINWAVARSEAISWIQGAAYTSA
jgi:HK97 family phage major capsid protein